MKILTLSLPYKVAYDIAEGKRKSFPLLDRSDAGGRLLIFSGEDGTAERPALSTVCIVDLKECRWNGNRWVYKVENPVLLVPHFPVKMQDYMLLRDVPDALIEPMPEKKNIMRWLRKDI